MFLVTGATGGIGRRVVRLLREQGNTCSRLCPAHFSLQRARTPGAELFIGDLQQEKIFKSLPGVQYIISAHGSDSDAWRLTTEPI